jgi:hypothetical protein
MKIAPPNIKNFKLKLLNPKEFLEHPRRTPPAAEKLLFFWHAFA